MTRIRQIFTDKSNFSPCYNAEALESGSFIPTTLHLHFMEELLTTKLFVPLNRPELVPRSNLIQRLTAGTHSGRKLTLISAPAGFGKTTLVTEWLHNLQGDAKQENHPQPRIAWLSLDEGDNDPVRFLTYFLAALKHIQGIDLPLEKSVAILQSAQPPPIEALLTSLINEIATVHHRIILSLDDYHLIENQPIHDGIHFFLDHMPPQMHLIIATREDPLFPLSRLRAQGQLTEMRAADLRFTFSECAEFINQAMGLNISEEDIAALEARTEGWIVGLQMAALSMQGRAEVTNFIQSFTGSHRFVLDYLIEEVLDQQPEIIQTFLLHTSILDRLCGPLCDEVLGATNGQETLENIEKANLLVVPLDDERKWFRYHHLFADVLQSLLMERQPDQIAALHQRASQWFEQNHQRDHAIRHAFAAQDYERAAGLLELILPTIDGKNLWTKWLGWIKALPDDVVRIRPVLCAGYGSTLLMIGELEAAEVRLKDAERWLNTKAELSTHPEDSDPGSEQHQRMVVTDVEQFRSLPASIAIARAYIAQATGDIPGTVNYARQVLENFTEQGDQLIRGQATTLLGLASWASGDLETARQAFSDFITLMRTADNVSNTISASPVLAEIMMAQGQLREAFATFQGALQLAADQGEPLPLGTEDLYRGISELYRERGDFETATQHLLTSNKLAEQDSQSDWQRRLYVSDARIKQSQGDLEGALAQLDNAERLSIRSPLPDVRPIQALKTRIFVAQGRLTEALGWAHERDLSIDDELSYLREFEHITLARLLMAQYQRDSTDDTLHAAMELLKRLLQAAEEGGRMGSMIEILALQAIVYDIKGDISAAGVALERALEMAEPEGYLRILADEGPHMARLLSDHFSGKTKSHYLQRLLAVFASEVPDISKTKTAETHLVDPLSKREIEVLQLISEGLSNQEIATRLYLSLNTVKVHTRNINSKLSVSSRAKAVIKAKALGILPAN
jgi:LuxR family transcriptional regulator, maltose regulon positive regulatory protein